MNLRHLIQHQQQHYDQFHQDRRNLWVHLATVPLFQLSHLGLLAALSLGNGLAALGWLLVALLSIAAQGAGHAREARPAEPFTGLANALLRIELEQWLAFPRFVFSGGLRAALQRRAPTRAPA